MGRATHTHVHAHTGKSLPSVPPSPEKHNLPSISSQLQILSQGLHEVDCEKLITDCKQHLYYFNNHVLIRGVTLMILHVFCPLFSRPDTDSN